MNSRQLSRGLVDAQRIIGYSFRDTRILESVFKVVELKPDDPEEEEFARMRNRLFHFGDKHLASAVSIFLYQVPNLTAKEDEELLKTIVSNRHLKHIYSELTDLCKLQSLVLGFSDIHAPRTCGNIIEGLHTAILVDGGSDAKAISNMHNFNQRFVTGQLSHFLEKDNRIPIEAFKKRYGIQSVEQLHKISA
jgi:tRNA nucleotidyltransferase/poly(A) polymerase